MQVQSLQKLIQLQNSLLKLDSCNISMIETKESGRLRPICPLDNLLDGQT